MIKSNQCREQSVIKRESTLTEMFCAAEETKVALSSAGQWSFMETQNSACK